RRGSGTDGATRALAGAGVGAGALAANRQAALVAQSAVAAEVDQALDVHRGLATQVALDGELGDLGAQLVELALGERLDLGVGLDARGLADLQRARLADPVDRAKRDVRVLVGGNVDAGD